MRIERRFTKKGQSAYSDISFRTTSSEIRNPDGSIVFQLKNLAVPELWSQVAADIIAQKYFRKAGVPARLKRVEENAVPSWLWRSVPDDEALEELPEDERLISETDARQPCGNISNSKILPYLSSGARSLPISLRRNISARPVCLRV